MTWLEALLVFVAGIAAGTINTIVGSGTLITFPVLLGIGLSPVTANVTNTLGLVRRVRWSAPMATGASSKASAVGRSGWARARRSGRVIGAVLLLVLPASAFKAIVPVLVGLALVLVDLGPWLSRRLADRPAAPGDRITPALWLATFATGVYGGYFGAAQGVLLVGILGVLTYETLQRINALKNVLAGLVEPGRGASCSCSPRTSTTPPPA